MENSSINLQEAFYFTNNTETSRKVPPYYVYEVIIFFFVVRTIEGALALIGNSLTIVALYTYEDLRSPTNYLVVSLAVADCLSSLVPVFQLLLYIYPTSRYWVILCLVSESFNMITSSSNYHTIMWISFDRWLYLMHPFKYHELVTSKRVTILVCLLWTFTVGQVILGVGLGNTLRPGMQCRYAIFLKPAVFNALFVTELAVITIIIVLLYIQILILSWKHRNKIRDQQMSVSARGAPAAQPSLPSENNGQGAQLSLEEQEAIARHAQQQKREQTENRATKVLSIILGVYLLSTLPAALFSVILNTAKPTKLLFVFERLFALTWWVQSFSNPAIYAWKSKEFRRAFVKLLRLRNNTVAPENFHVIGLS